MTNNLKIMPFTLNKKSYLAFQNTIVNSNNFKNMFFKKIKNLCLTASLATISLAANSQTLDDAVRELDSERFVNANQMLNKIASSKPDVQTAFLRGYALLRSPESNQQKLVDEAQSIFNSAFSLTKKPDPLIQVGLGMVRLASNDAPGAKLIFDQVRKDTKSKDPNILYRIAEAYTMFKSSADPGQAIMDINMAIEKAKKVTNPEFYIVKSDAYLLKNEGGDAMTALTYAENLGLKKGRIYEKMARVWLQSRNYNEAEKALNKGIAADPQHAPLYKYQSSYYQARNNYQKAAESAKLYLVNSDSDCKAQIRYAKLAYICRDFNSVKTAVADAKACSDDPYLVRMEGLVAFQEGRHQEAIKSLNKFIGIAPKDENLGMDYGHIGRSYILMPTDSINRPKNDSLGIANVEKAMSLGDSSVNYYQELGSAFLKAKNYPLAALYAEKNVQRKPKPAPSDFATVGTYYYYAKNWATAEQYVEKALPIYQDKWLDGYALLARIKTYKNDGDSTYAKNFMSAPHYETYLAKIGAEGKKDPKNKRNVMESLFYLMGREFQLNNNIDKGKEILNEILTIDPTNARALDVKTQLEPPAPTSTPAPAPAAVPTPAPKAPKK
ncbi:MAG: hypothetical protein ACRCVT_12700 [Leadbetterella sp.]